RADRRGGSGWVRIGHVAGPSTLVGSATVHGHARSAPLYPLAREHPRLLPDCSVAAIDAIEPGCRRAACLIPSHRPQLAGISSQLQITPRAWSTPSLDSPEN